MKRQLLLVFALGCQASRLDGSWLSDITGVDINIPKGTVNVGPPNPGAIPKMLENLPKDASQFFLNPAGSLIATAIRQAKEQAKYGCRPIPSRVKQELSAFYPTELMSGVCYGTLDATRFGLDTLLLQDFTNRGAITLEDVVVFKNSEYSSSPDNTVLWAHELMHVVQYRRLGLETFAHLYTTQSAAMESEASNMENFVRVRMQTSQPQQQYWQYSGATSQQSSSGITNQQYKQYAKQAIDPRTCARFSSRPGFVDVINECPVTLRIVSMALQNVYTGQTNQIGCNSSPCTLAPKTMSTWPEPQPYKTVAVYPVW